LKKILTVIGARPQFIKAVIVSKELLHRYEEVVLHTGQHYDENMSGVFFRELGLRDPDINLGIGSGSHAEQTAGMLVGIEKAINSVQPDMVLVYGDTNSTLAGSLAGAKCGIPVAHVEAGLRSFNRNMPEEINRVITDHISELLFCPTDQSVSNLALEGITNQVHLVGDVMFDSFEWVGRITSKDTSLFDRLSISPQKYSLLTLHRAENTDDPERLLRILNAVNQLNGKIIFPVHPRTVNVIGQTNWVPASNVCMISPVGYIDMVQLEQMADCIITDSGGIQKEAYWAGVRCITLRKETEWVETVNTGWNVLVDDNPEEIIHQYASFRPTQIRLPVYGDGNAASKIVQTLESLI
jgi:UDP-GlcNAc3NAcA epimerase